MHTRSTSITALAVGAIAVVAIGLTAIGFGGSAGAHSERARATLRTADGSRLGTVTFTSRKHHTDVSVRIDRRSALGIDAFHGFHIHANDDAVNGSGCIADPALPPSTWFVAVDGHWKATGQTHGHHTGDLPSVYVNPDGSAETRFTIDKVALSSIKGRAVVLHAGADNFGNVPLGPAADQYTANAADATTKTGNTGNAGDRFACGVIG